MLPLSLQNASAGDCLVAFWYKIGRLLRALLVLGILLGIVAVAVLLRHRSTAFVADPPQATVNGETIRQSEFFDAMVMYCGPFILNHLVEEKMLNQEAARQHVTLDEDEQKEIEQAGSGPYPPEVKGARMAQARYDLLLRKLTLSGVTEERKRQIYDLFKDDMTQYEIFHISVGTLEEAKDILTSLKQGMTFEELATRSLDLKSRYRGGLVGFSTRPLLIKTVGPTLADILIHLKEGETTQPVLLWRRFHIFKMGRIKSSYEDLKPSIENQVIYARHAGLLFDISKASKVTSPYLSESEPVVTSPIDAHGTEEDGTQQMLQSPQPLGSPDDPWRGHR